VRDRGRKQNRGGSWERKKRERKERTRGSLKQRGEFKGKTNREELF
jgi:hypothetical protein